MPTAEYYPYPEEILQALSGECILVGSAVSKNLEDCKDVDFVISDKGLAILKKWEYWLSWDSSQWAVLIPYEQDDHKTLEFFNGICAIEDPNKWSNRLTYEQASEQPLTIREIYGAEVFSLNATHEIFKE